MGGKTKLRQEQIIQAAHFKIHENWQQNLDFASIAAGQNVGYEWFCKTF
jgi:hypothetical protein